MISLLDAKTFMVRLLFFVIGCACSVWLCVTCYNSRRQQGLMKAYMRRKAKRDAPINSSFVPTICGSSQIAATHWLEHGDRGAQPWQEVGSPAADAMLLSSRRFSVDSAGTSAQHARVPPAVPLLGWNQMTLSGPPFSSVTVEASADDGTSRHRSIQVDPNRFTSPPLVLLATGNARVALIKPLRKCFMLHSVVLAPSAEVLENVLLEAAELRKLEPHPSLLRLCAVVTDQPCGEVGLLSELTTGSLATLLDSSPIQLTWANGLLALATDVAAGLAHLHGLGLYHGRLFLYTVLITSKWRAKLSEYALDPFLELTRGGLSSAGGNELLPSEEHPASSVLFLSPEKCSGKMAAVVQPQRLPTTTEPIAPRRGWPGDPRRLAQSSRAMQRSSAAPIAPSGTRLDKPKTMPTKWLGEQRADAWAFGCVLASLALHQKRAKELSSKAGLHRAPRRGRDTPAAVGRRSVDDMYGWDEYTNVSKDRPGRCSRLKLAAEAADRPRGRRTSCVERRFQALGELSSRLKRSKCAVPSGASCSDHGQSSYDTPEADAPLASAPPSPPTSPADVGAAPALARVIAPQTSAEEWSLEQPRAEISEAVRTQFSTGQLANTQSSLIGHRSVTPQVSSRRRQQGRATIAPALQRVSTPETPRAALQMGPAGTPRRVIKFELGPATTALHLRLEQSRLTTLVDTQPVDAKEVAMAPPVPPTRYVLMLRLCQGKVSLLDGVTPSCCPKPLLQLATQCCTRSPEERPSLAAVLEQLQGKVLLSIDAAAHGTGARRPLPALKGWRDAAERRLLGKEPPTESPLPPPCPPIAPSSLPLFDSVATGIGDATSCATAQSGRPMSPQKLAARTHAQRWLSEALSTVDKHDELVSARDSPAKPHAALLEEPVVAKARHKATAAGVGAAGASLELRRRNSLTRRRIGSEDLPPLPFAQKDLSLASLSYWV